MRADIVGMNNEGVILDLLQDTGAAGSFTRGQGGRKEARIPWDPVLVRIAVEGGDFIPVSAQIVNMSKSGVGLLVTKQLHLRPGVTVVIELNSLLITGAIRHCVRSRVGAGPFYVGLRIENIEQIQ
jgi:hypothetical protein